MAKSKSKKNGKKKLTPEERALRVVVNLKQVAMESNVAISRTDKGWGTDLLNIRKAMFVKPVKSKPVPHQPILRVKQERGFRCTNCKCVSIDAIRCPWIRAKNRSQGVDIHSYPHTMSPLTIELERRLLYVTQNYFMKHTIRDADFDNEEVNEFMRKRVFKEQGNQDLVILNKWSPHEIAVFEAAIAVFGKEFTYISRLLPNKSTEDVIAFYTIWHFSSHYCIWKNQRQV